MHQTPPQTLFGMEIKRSNYEPNAVLVENNFFNYCMK